MSMRDKVVEYNRQTRDALKTVYETLNQGQRKKLLKNADVKRLFERYNVLTEDGEDMKE